MRRSVTTLALALCLLGCSPKPEPVALLSGVSACFLTMFPIWGRLLPDPDYGTTLDGVPIVWPEGSTGVRLAGGGVEVRVPDGFGGEFVATTGKDYWMGNGMWSGNSGGLADSANAFPACSVADAGPETIKGGGIVMPAQRAGDWLQSQIDGRKEALADDNIGMVMCDDPPRPDWCEWLWRNRTGGMVDVEIEEANLTVRVRKGTPVGIAEALCRDVAGAPFAMPAGYTHVDVVARPNGVIAECVVP